MKNQKVDNRITKEEFKELHSKRQSKTLTSYEKYKIRCKLKNLMQENILIHLYTKFLYFGMIEFNQRKFDIKIEVGTCTDDTITNNLKALQKMGYLTQEFKRVKDKKYKRLHFNINIEKMNEILTTGEELKPENFSRLIETLRRQNEVVKANPFDTTKKKNTPKVEITDNIVDTITIEDNKPKTVEITDNSIATTYNSNDDDSNELIGIGFEDDNNDTTIEEFKPIEDFEDDEMIDNDVKGVIKPIKELNPTVESNRAKAKAIIDNKINPKINDYLDKLKLTNYDIHFLLSDGYTDGSNKDLDDKKRILNLIADNLIEL